MLLYRFILPIVAASLTVSTAFQDVQDRPTRSFSPQRGPSSPPPATSMRNQKTAKGDQIDNFFGFAGKTCTKAARWNECSQHMRSQMAGKDEGTAAKIGAAADKIDQRRDWRIAQMVSKAETLQDPTLLYIAKEAAKSLQRKPSQS